MTNIRISGGWFNVIDADTQTVRAAIVQASILANDLF